jgi:hypothetical protein
LCILLSISRCTKKDVVPDLKGTIVGYIFTFDEFALSTVSDDNSGVLVVALGKTAAYRTFSEKSGRFEFDDLPAGTYELQFIKEGYGTLKQFGIKHLGGEPTIVDLNFGKSDSDGSFIPAYFLYEIPTTEITSMKIENNVITCTLKFIKPAPDYIGLRLYFSRSENFEIKDAQYVIPLQYFQKDGDNYNSAYSINFANPGEKIYYKACIDPTHSSFMIFNRWYLAAIDSYFDYESNQMVYPSLGEISAQYSFISPE